MRISEAQIDRFHNAAATLTFGKFCLMLLMSLIWFWGGLYIPAENRALDKKGIITSGVVVDKKLKSRRRGTHPYIYYRYSFEDDSSQPLKHNSSTPLKETRDYQRVSRDVYKRIQIGDKVEVTYLRKKYRNESRITPPLLSSSLWYCISVFAGFILAWTIFLAAVKDGYILKKAEN